MEPPSIRHAVTVKDRAPSPPIATATNSSGGSTNAATTSNGGRGQYGHHHDGQPPDLRVDTTTSSGSPHNSLHDGGVGGSAISPAAEPGGDPQRASKIAACLSCRRSKIRCEKGPDPSQCRKCAATGAVCIRPKFNVGRRKGVKNKRKGLEKAIYQVEEALTRVGPHLQSIDVGKVIAELKTLVSNGQEPQLHGPYPDNHHQSQSGSNKRPRLASTTHGGSIAGDPEYDDDDDSSDEYDDEFSPRERKTSIVPGNGARRPRRESMLSQPRRQQQQFHGGGHGGAGSSGGAAAGGRGAVAAALSLKPEERLAIDDAENPLQLLARASNLHLSPESGSMAPSPGTAVSVPGPASSGVQAVEETDPEMRRVETFFGTTHFNIDCGEDYDPIDLGLVSEDEAEMLFDFFHKNLSHTRWGLDPVLYTVPWTRSRSPFLFTSIMSASALFIETAAALSKRLGAHARLLAQRVFQKRHRSSEIVLAFMINVPWMGPGVHSTDDETCWYVALAQTIAIDLQMGKLSMSEEAFRNGTTGDLARQECIDPELALRSGGFRDVDPNSELGRRLVRRRERCWIALFVLERGMCLARGRSYTLPMTSLIRRVDQWHISDIADRMDGALVSMAVLRRDLDGVFDAIRAMCKGAREGMADGTLIARSIQTTVEKFFEQWYLEWGQTIGQGPQNRIPAYVEILLTHTRLSIYSSVINLPTAPLEVRHFFRTAGLSAALNVMRAAVQGEKQLFSMPNNTAIMVSFAACFALRLSSQIAAAGSTPSNASVASGGAAAASANTIAALAPSVRTLIEELADVLAKIGNITRHRNGMCGLYARYLRILVRKAAAETGGSGSGSGVLVRSGLGKTAFGRPQAFVETSAASSSRNAIFGGGANSAAMNGHGGSGSGSNGGQSAHTPTGGVLNAFAVPPPPPPPHTPTGIGSYEQAASSSPSWAPVGGGGGAAGGDGTDLFPFSSMSGDQIIETLSRAGGEFDINNGGGGVFGGGGIGGGAAAGGAGIGSLVWDEGAGLDFLPAWNNWPDFGFG